MRSKRNRFPWPLLASATLVLAVTPAKADLVTRYLVYGARAQVVQVDSTGTHSTADATTRTSECLFNVCTTSGTGYPLALAAAEPMPSQQAHAAQDGWGAFGQRQAVALTNYETGVQQVHGHTSTLFSVTVGSDRPNTPVQVDFRWLGSRVAAGTLYGEGFVDASSSVQVLVSRNGGLEQLVWGFDDATRKVPGSAGGMFTDRHSEVDTLGVGLPDRSFEAEWREFMVWGDIERGAHFGTMDFGVLQPGETFTLSYRVLTNLSMSDVRYASRGELLLDDPFSVGQPAFSFRGLDYTFDDAPVDPPGGVPEPGSLPLLLAAGTAAVVWRRRRPQAATAAGTGSAASQASMSRGSVMALTAA